MKFTVSFKYALILALLSACSSTKNEMPGPVTPPAADTSGSKMTAWITTGDAASLLKRMPAEAFSTAAPRNKVVTIDSSQQYQSMDGFGYTLTGGSAVVINKMSQPAKTNLLNELFADAEGSMDINFIRISIGASDLSAEVFTYDDIPEGETDPQLQQFSLAKDMDDLIPLLKRMLQIDPQIKILATPWTPPVWMKDNGSSIGGSLKPEYYGVYAQYFVKYIQEMAKEGITIYAVTPQNEPLHPGNNPSLLMTAEQQTIFIKDHLGPAFKQAALDTRIIVCDHNCDRPDYPLTILNDPEAKAFVDGSAFHLYAGDISAMSQVHNAHPDKNIYFTEQYTSSDGQFGGDLRWHMKNLMVGAPRNFSRTVLEWNLANNVNYGPHTPGGCTTCKGALTIDGDAVKRNVAYYIIAHASRFVPAGSVRVSSSAVTDLPNIAYRTPGGEFVVIVLNDGADEASFSIKLGDRNAPGTLPAGAAGTYVVEIEN